MRRKKLTARQRKARRRIVNRNNYRNSRTGTFEKRLKDIVSGSRARAKKRGHDFTIGVETFPPQSHCRLFPEREFRFDATPKNNQYSMSIDRIDPAKGYTPDNTWLICNRANRIKNDATFEEFETIYLNWRAELIRRGQLP